MPVGNTCYLILAGLDALEDGAAVRASIEADLAAVYLCCHKASTRCPCRGYHYPKDKPDTTGNC